MLDAFIIEEIRRRERLDDRQQPYLERPGAYPMPYPPAGPDAGMPDRVPPRGYDDEDSDSHNGVIILDM